jgi:hypothetical protein
MYLCYLDESGGIEAPDSSRTATPVMVILSLVVDASRVPNLTRDFLALKRRHFPGRYRIGRALDHILTEVKGSEILQMTRSPSRDKRRQAQVFRAELLDLCDSHDCRILGRVWVKEPGKVLKQKPTYDFAVQDIAEHFSQYLQVASAEGVLIADGRSQFQNVNVAHSIFTQKWRTGGDPYPYMREVPLFAHSDNHAGLQLADLVASTFVFPMAATAYCKPTAGMPHSSPYYDDVRRVFGRRLQSRQYRYRDETGRWRGGLVVSDPVGRQSGSLLFGT